MTTHAISAEYSGFDRMSPTAAALAVLLHVAVALALWWLPQLTPLHDINEDPIDVTIEQPPPPPAPEPQPSVLPEAKPLPPPPPPQAAQPAPSKSIQAPPLGLPPPSPTTGETNKQEGPKNRPKEQAAVRQITPQTPTTEPAQPTTAAPEAATPEPAKPDAAKAEPAKAEPAKPDQSQRIDPKPALPPESKPVEQALAPREVLPPPKPAPPPLERMLPPLEAPPPPLTSQDFPKLPPPPPPAAVHPQARTAPPPPAPTPPHQAPAPNPALRPSPLTNPAPHRSGPSEPSSNAPSTAFVNPADNFNQAKIVEQYLWQVAAKISQYRYYSNQTNEQGVVVIRLVISRSGHLLEASVARSSGIINLDKGVLDAARAASPYAPFPEGIPGAQQAFILPLSSVYRR